MENGVQLCQCYQTHSVQRQTSALLTGLPWTGHVNDVLTASDPFRSGDQIPTCRPSPRRSQHVDTVHPPASALLCRVHQQVQRKVRPL